MAHTSGPWETYYGGCPEATNVCNDSGHIAAFETAEDARLCAAAPDMLAALKAFNMTEKNIISGTADSITIRVPITVIQQAAAVIAKAEGSQP